MTSKKPINHSRSSMDCFLSEPVSLLILSLLLLSPENLCSAAELSCLTNSACSSIGGVPNPGCLATQTCPNGCRLRRYARPPGELLALRLDCASPGEVAGSVEIRYCRHRLNCNRPDREQFWLPSQMDHVKTSQARQACLDGTGQSKLCRSGEMCVTLDDKPVGCQADMLQLYELLNTSSIARYSVTHLVCRDRSMCTGTAEMFLPTTDSPMPTTTQAELDDKTSSASTEQSSTSKSSGCLQKLLRWGEDTSVKGSRRANASLPAADDDQALALCMRQLWLSNSRESNTGDAADGVNGRGRVGVSVGNGAGGDSAGGILLKALTLAVCLLCAVLLIVLIRSLLTRRRRLRAARRRRRRQRQELQQQLQQQQQQQQIQQQQQQFLNSPTGSAMTTLTLPRRAVQLLLQFDEQLQLQQQQQQQQLHQCASTVHSSPCATIRRAACQAPHLLLTPAATAAAAVATSQPTSSAGAANVAGYEEDVDLDEDTFV